MTDREKKQAREIITALVARIERGYGLLLEPDGPNPSPRGTAGSDFFKWPQDVAFGAVRYDLEPRWRMAQHFEPEADLVLVDFFLGTLGLVYVVTDNSPRKIRTRVSECVDRATYVRHLLLNDPDLGYQRPWSVELGLLFPAESGVSEATRCLREIARQTDYLHAIGVGLLAYQDGKFDDLQFSRAFPWLLCHTREWFQAAAETRSPSAVSEAQGRPEPSQPPMRLETLRLDHYRNVERRELKLGGGPPEGQMRVHLFHGHNGTGKSSLVEALELVMTGTADRLAHVPSLTTVVTRASSKPNVHARIALTVANRPEPRLEYEVREKLEYKGREKLEGGVLALGRPGAFFRLNQETMGRLANRGAAERAETFLRAWFPEDPAAARYRQAVQETQKALNELPATLQLGPAEGGALQTAQPGTEKGLPPPASPPEGMQSEPPEARQPGAEEVTRRARQFLERFSWLAHTDAIPTGAVEDCYPVPAELLQRLAPGEAAIKVALEDLSRTIPDQPTLERLLAALDDAVSRVAQEAEKAREALTRAVGSLDRLAGWTAAAGGPSHLAWDELLNQWLEARALTDLAWKRYQDAQTLERAGQLGWAGYVGPGEITLDPPAAPSARLQEVWKALDQRSRELESQLRHAQSGATAAHERASVPRLNPRDVEALNAAGLRLKIDELGTLIDRALTQNHPEIAGSRLTIGSPDWAAGLLNQLRSLTEVYGELARVGWPSGAARLRLQLLRTAAEVCHRLVQEDVRIRERFLKVIQGGGTGQEQSTGLNRALNELLALFTPARWAYGDLSLSLEPDPEHGQPTLRMTEDGGPADLKLNTAELTLFTLSLFLLCAPKQPNPLRLLILDDPLQNMDELTVTSLARGLARVVCLLPDWQFLILLHAEDDLQRFRQELPAAVYCLPWLTRSAASETETPRAETITRELREDLRGRESELQRIDLLFEPSPRTTGTTAGSASG